MPFYLTALSSSIMTIVKGTAWYGRKKSIVRIYLMEDRRTARFLLGNGVTKDIPISGIVMSHYNPRSCMLYVDVNGDSHIIAVNQAANIDLTLVWAIS